MNILKFFKKETEPKKEFDNSYFIELCKYKKNTENMINEVKDLDVIEVLEQELVSIDAKISLIIKDQKKARQIVKKQRTVPIFVNGEVL